MAEVLVNSGSGVTEMALSTAYALGDRMVVNRASTGTNYLVARRYVWECTTAGTTDASYPAYSSSYTPDSSTLTSGTAVFTCRNPGYSSGSTKDWTFATIFLFYAFRAAITDLDVIKVHKTHQESWTTDVTNNNFGPQASVYVICVDKDAGEALAVMDHTTYWIGTGAASLGIIPTSGASVYMYGIVLKCGDGATSSEVLYISSAWDGQIEFESCYLWMAATGATSQIRISNGSDQSIYERFKNCTFRFENVSQLIYVGEARLDWDGCSISPDGAKPNILFRELQTGAKKVITGCDLSWVGVSILGTLDTGHHTFEFVNCKFPAGIPVWSTGTPSNKNLGGGEAFVFNCSSGDTHYNFGYYNTLGSVESVTSIYADDGALYDGTNHVTWKITTTAYCDQIRKFETPWIEKYHSGTSAITPYLEILRDGSVTAYQDDEVWGEFSYQGTAGSTRATLVNDGMSMLGTPADQAAGVGLSGWTGEAASAWSGKLSPASAITPAEIGFLRARVCVAAPSIEVYVDPKIRT